MKHLFISTVLLTVIFFTANAQDKPLETVAGFGNNMAIGTAASPDNRLFVSFPKRPGAFTYSLTEIIHGERVPFPNKEINTDNADQDKCFVNVQDLYADTQNNLWVLDSKPSASGGIAGLNKSDDTAEGYFKIVQINLKDNKIEKIYHLKGLNRKTSGLNDLTVDTDKKLAYLSDPGQAAVIVLNLQTDEARTVFPKTKYTTADTNIVLKYGDHEMRNAAGKPFVSNVNSIALTRDNKYFYFKPINCNVLYRIATKYLADENLSEKEIESKIETIPNAGITHGMVADDKGNIYLTNSTLYSIRYLSPDGKIHVLIKDPNILWPDSMGIGSDGYLYFSCSQLNMESMWNNGVDKRQLPYRVFRVKTNN